MEGESGAPGSLGSPASDPSAQSAEVRAVKPPAGSRLESAETFLTDPKYRRWHFVVLTFALLAHSALHYATYLPALRGPISNLPYFRLHSLHEAEYLLVIVYASLVFRLKGGLTAVGITAVTSLPFLLTPFIFGRQPRPDELRDLAIQVAFVLLMGTIIALLYEWVARERDRRLALADHIEESNRALLQRNQALGEMSQRLQATNNQLNGLNGTVQTRLNRLYGDLEQALDEEMAQLVTLRTEEITRERFAGFLARVRGLIKDS